MHISGKILFLICCFTFVGCHHWRSRHHACVDQGPYSHHHGWDQCDDDDDDDDGCLWFGRKHNHCRPCEPACYPATNYGFAPPIYGSPMSQCGCETAPTTMPMISGNWYGDMSGLPMASGCSTCGNTPTVMPTYPTFSTEPTFVPQTLDNSSLAPTPTPTPAPASEYYNPQPTPSVPTPTSSDSAALPQLGTPTGF